MSLYKFGYYNLSVFLTSETAFILLYLYDTYILINNSIDKGKLVRYFQFQLVLNIIF